MPTLTNPSEIARETLKLLTARKTPPTPDNYLTIYHEISGTRPSEKHFPEKQLRSLANAFPRITPDQLRLARLLDEAVKHEDWDAYRKHLVDFVNTLSASQKLGWGQLIADLLSQLEAKHVGLTSARKRESLQHILNGAGANPDTLFNRLQNLIRSWGQGKAQECEVDSEINAPNTVGEEYPDGKSASTSNTGPVSLLPEVIELLAFTLENVISIQLHELPILQNEIKQLAGKIRQARRAEDFNQFLVDLKRFVYKLGLASDDQLELKNSLLNLLRLVVDNISDLVMDDQWLQGQIAIVKDIIDKPLSQRTIDDAQRRMKEVLFKQSQLKLSLQEAKDAIKNMLAGFIDQLAGLADATTEYHDTIEHCAEKITAANDIESISNVLGEVMRETRNMQFSVQKSRDELRSTQKQVQESEARIQELERELENTSQLVRYDQLTGVLNRRGLEEIFNKEIARSERHDNNLCIGMLDIDNFKKLNDSLGHDAGDAALVHLTKICRETLRPQDTVARFGGEEFIILLPETPLEEAEIALTRLQRELTRKFFMHANEKVLITFSAGLTQYQPNDTQTSSIKRADEAMYEAKRSGKNRVVCV